MTRFRLDLVRASSDRRSHPEVLQSPVFRRGKKFPRPYPWYWDRGSGNSLMDQPLDRETFQPPRSKSDVPLGQSATETNQEYKINWPWAHRPCSQTTETKLFLSQPHARDCPENRYSDHIINTNCCRTTTFQNQEGTSRSHGVHGLHHNYEVLG